MKPAGALLLVTLALPLTGCAYYNTFYLARKNYDKATLGEPYIAEPTNASQPQFYAQTITYSKKLLAQYPKSKWVDDAYLLWARSLIGRDDPIEAINLLNDFATRFPRSPIEDEARFYLGVANRRAHRPAEALAALDEFITRNPKHALVPYALLEKSRALFALERRAEAADAAGQIIDRYPKTTLMRSVRIARSDALLADGQYEKARDDFRALGLAATDDEQRFVFLLREADCIEGAREYDREIELLRGALAHEVTPVVTRTTTSTGATVATGPSGPGADRWGRLRLRVGTAYLMAGRIPQALQEFREVIESYPKHALAAEAQYRIGYAYETVGDDFENARIEYGRVKEQSAGSSYTREAATRLADLDRLSTLRTSGGRDSAERKAEAGFMLAELYLFNHNRPERALEEYRQLEQQFRGTPWGGKAINAQAWVLRRKLNHPAAADSLLWNVIHDYRATDAQIAARDYLEAQGVSVPDSLIVRPLAKLDTALTEADTLRLTPPPADLPRIGAPVGTFMSGATADSAMMPQGAPPAARAAFPGFRGVPGPGDSARFVFPSPSPFARPDTLAHRAAADTSRVIAPTDTSGRHP